jgi:hypothetical protein
VDEIPAYADSLNLEGEENFQEFETLAIAETDDIRRVRYFIGFGMFGWEDAPDFGVVFRASVSGRDINRPAIECPCPF